MGWVVAVVGWLHTIGVWWGKVGGMTRWVSAGWEGFGGDAASRIGGIIMFFDHVARWIFVSGGEGGKVSGLWAGWKRWFCCWWRRSNLVIILYMRIMCCSNFTLPESANHLIKFMVWYNLIRD